MRAGLLATAICASLGGSIADAQAPAAALAIGGVEVTGATSPALQVAVVAAVRAGLGAATPDPGAVGACVTPGCLTVAAQAAGVQRVVAVTVAVSGEFHDQFQIAIVVTDDRGRALRRRASECATCAVDEATERVTALVAEAVTALTDDSVAVEIVTSPVPAALVVDGTPRGQSPWAGALPAGPHRAVAGATVEHEFFIEASGAPQRIDVTLPMAANPRRRFGVITYGTAAVGAGVLIFGAALVAKDGEPTCAHPSCPEVYDTGTLGWLSVGIGLGALGAAGYMFWNDRQAGHPVIAVVPTDGGAAAVAAGRF